MVTLVHQHVPVTVGSAFPPCSALSDPSLPYFASLSVSWPRVEIFFLLPAHGFRIKVVLVGDW